MMTMITQVLESLQPIWAMTASNWPFILVGSIALGFWFAFQFLALHYWNFLREYRKPRLDVKRLERAERALRFQREELERVYAQMGKLRQEVLNWMREETQGNVVKNQASSTRNNEKASPSFESNFLSLGEIQLKQKIQQLKSSAERPH